jgi:hypothetical protein
MRERRRRSRLRRRRVDGVSFAVDCLALSDEDYELVDLDLTSEVLTIMTDAKWHKSCQLNGN